MRAVLIGIGVVSTMTYLIIAYFFFSPVSGLVDFLKSAPYNERGDFLAGVFGPIAFLWLIIGYFLQSIELSLQREELTKR